MAERYIYERTPSGSKWRFEIKDTVDGKRIAACFSEENAKRVADCVNAMDRPAGAIDAKFVPDDYGGHIEFAGKVWRPAGERIG